MHTHTHSKANTIIHTHIATYIFSCIYKHELLHTQSHTYKPTTQIHINKNAYTYHMQVHKRTHTQKQ